MNLKLIVLDNCQDLGLKVNKYLNDNCLIPIINSRFANGEGKVKIEDSVRDKDLYIISDVGNYSINYQLHGLKHYMSPDEHFQDIKEL